MVALRRPYGREVNIWGVRRGEWAMGGASGRFARAGGRRVAAGSRLVSLSGSRLGMRAVGVGRLVGGVEKG